MTIEENRNCGCGCGNNDNYENTNYTNMTDLATDYANLSEEYDNGCNNDNMEINNCNVRREMMQEIRSLQFAIIELGLYLDTHPNDQKALCLHKKYCKQMKELKDKYQKVYGPLTINYPCNKWRWLEEPWVSFYLETIF